MIFFSNALIVLFKKVLSFLKNFSFAWRNSNKSLPACPSHFPAINSVENLERSFVPTCQSHLTEAVICAGWGGVVVIKQPEKMSFLPFYKTFRLLSTQSLLG